MKDKSNDAAVQIIGRWRRRREATELDIGRVYPWVGLGHKIVRLGWVGSDLV